jgi:hypothetical protein
MPFAPKRSPNYPGIDLKAAVEKLNSLFKAAKRHPVGVGIAITSMGYSPKSSSGMIAMGALRAFGLLEDVKDQKEPMVKLSITGLDIVADYPSNSEGWCTAVATAALNPKIHNDLWTRYGESLPVDDEIQRYLIREKGFIDSAAVQFIAEYKSTLAFAKLTSGDIIDPDAIEDEPEGDAMDTSAPEKPRVARQRLPVERQHLPATHPMTQRRDAPIGPYISFPLPGGNLIEIRLRSKVCKVDFDRIKALLDLSEDSLVEKGGPPVQ